VANRTLDGSKPDWNLIGHPEPPEGSPNVLLVLIDDAGFGNAGTFGTSGCTATRPGPPARGF
jgi:arylsulfatase